MSAKFTPGPWQARCLRETQRTYCTILAARGDIATIGSSKGMPAAEIDANARLIAAAPDLLDSLCEMVAELLEHASLGLNADEVAMLRRAEAAIAKAK